MNTLAFLDNLCNGSNAMNAKETILTLLANDADAEPDPCLWILYASHADATAALCIRSMFNVYNTMS